MGEQVFFWVMAPLTVLASLTLLFARKAVYAAAGMIGVMILLAAIYIHLEAPFLGLVQIIVYTGAIMMLILFVLMLVGVDQRESLKETIRGQRWFALAGALGIALLVAAAIDQVALPANNLKNANTGGNPQVIANILFGEWVLVIEILGLLLIAAAVGAVVLTQLPPHPTRGQKERAEARIKERLNPVNKPMPGVYARRNALDVPALDPDGRPLDVSVSRVLKARGQDKDGSEWSALPRQSEEADE